MDVCGGTGIFCLPDKGAGIAAGIFGFGGAFLCGEGPFFDKEQKMEGFFWESDLAGVYLRTDAGGLLGIPSNQLSGGGRFS